MDVIWIGRERKIVIVGIPGLAERLFQGSDYFMNIKEK